MYKYGWKQQAPDGRDYLAVPNMVKTYPDTQDMRPEMPPVYDQGHLGSCTANAIGAAVQHRCLRQKYKWAFTPSRLFIYYNERDMEGHTDSDAGANIRDGMKSINTLGVCPEAEADGSLPTWIWPYSDDDHTFKMKPPPQCYTDAVLHKSLTYAAINLDRESVLQTLSDGNPIVFGFLVHQSFESQKTKDTGIMQVPGFQLFDPILGGHAVMAVGYLLNHPMGDQRVKDWVIVRNSWGEGWGDKGYFYMPLDKVMCGHETSDAWVIHVMSGNQK